VDNIKKFIGLEEEETNLHGISIGVECLKIYIYLKGHLNDRKIQEIIDWKGDKVVFEYRDLLNEVHNNIGIQDYGSNYVQEKFLDFIEWSIFDISDRKFKELTVQKQEKLKKIKKEQITLQNELDALLGD